jgi:hypothetical protein
MAQRSTKPRAKLWGCPTCKFRKNLAAKTRCQVCNQPRPADKFAVREGGQVYLCHCITSAHFPTVSICRIFPTPLKASKVILPSAFNTLEENVRAAIRENIDVFEIRPEVNSESEGSEAISAAAMSSEEREEKEQATKARMSEERSKLSLFDRVMYDASDLAYDAAIGQYVHVDTTSDRTDTHHLTHDLGYVKFMQREKLEMTRIVDETKRRRDDKSLFVEHSEIDDIAPPIGTQHKCQLCEVLFPKIQLVGMITYKAIAAWREHRGIVVDYGDPRFCKYGIHDAALLCVYCTQFFDKDFSDVMESKASEENFAASEGILRGTLHCTNSVYKRMMRKLIVKQQEIHDRPMSRIEQKVTVAQLKFRLGSVKPTIFEFSSKAPTTLREKYQDVRRLLLIDTGGYSPHTELLASIH